MQALNVLGDNALAERPSHEEIDKWHGWFAREANNRAWALTEQEGLGEDGKREALLTAYASVYHWSKIGAPVHMARGRLLLARVHAVRGEGDQALANARAAFDFVASADAEPWEMAFAHAAMADSARVAGDRALFDEHYKMAEAIGATLDDEDREIFNKTFDRISAPAKD
jgi:hypothetical protein